MTFIDNKNLIINCITRKTTFIIILCLLFSCTTYKKITEETFINETSPNIEAYGNFIWSRKKDSTILIHKENLKRIVRKTETSNDVLFSDLDLYLLFLTKKRNEVAKNLNFSEQAYIAGHVINYLYKCQEKFNKNDKYKNKKIIYRLLSPWDNNNYDREFKKHNYYGLQLLKKEHLKHYKYFPDLDTTPYKKRIIE